MGFIYEDVNRRGRAYLEAHLKPSRLAHTERVIELAAALSERFGEDVAKAETAALFHDMARSLPLQDMNEYVTRYGLEERYLDEPNLAHAKIAAEMMRRDFGIDDREILDAVSYHTTGRAGMSRLEKIVFLADGIEPGRDYPSVSEARRLADEDLDAACLFSLERMVAYLKQQGKTEGEIDKDTLQALQDLKEKKEKEKC